ncbi:phosphatidate cytidylyltransferase [Blattabacterium cuenoti]|uniref:phosphatidate cytidylyltransferase n=1 Tax=Blattabacterium cuenoti TaxID=1653831 RepID=UPI00163C191E|nr:phosphatidate cytidylyltransferase [Blattabacterium cuenoti]
MIKKKNLDFLIRIFSGIIHIIIIIFSIEKGDKLFRIMMMLFSFICLTEFLMISNTKIFLKKLVFLLFLIIIIVDIFFVKNGLILYIMGFFYYFLFFSIIQLFNKSSYEEKMINIKNILFGLTYIVVPFFISCYIYSLYGKKMILGIFILIWINDSLSYVVGKKWGKNKISISISPKKSIEGCFGGLLFCIIIGIVLSKIWEEKYWLFFSFIISIFGTIGDLIESTIKRSYGVKNSGIWFPGHGGFFDRLDSFIFVIPIIFVTLLGFYHFFQL